MENLLFNTYIFKVIDFNCSHCHKSTWKLLPE